VGTVSGVCAFNTNGTQKWSADIGVYVASSPAIGHDGSVVFGSREGKVYAVDGSGAKKWEVPVGEVGASSPAIAPDGTIYIGTRAARLVALSPTGEKKWEFALPNFVDASPALGADGTIYCTAQGIAPVGIGGLFAITPAGVERWRLLEFAPYSSPVLGTDGTIFVLTFWCSLLAVEPETGSIKWRTGSAYNAEKEMASAPAVANDGLVYYGTLGTGDSIFYAINPNGTTNWSLSLGPRVYGAPAVGTNGTVYFCSGGTLYAVRGSAPLANSPWPKFRQNLSNTGKVEKPALKQPQKRSDAGFQFDLYPHELGLSYTIESSSNLNTWTSLTSFVATAFPTEVVDLDASNFPVRFYRAWSP
jgi:outer membrane protein assembly factor BamB